jgi:integrase
VGIYKRCRCRDRVRCTHEWYGSFKLPGVPRAKVSLTTWTGDEIDTKGQAEGAFDELKREVRAGTFDKRGRSVLAARRPAGITFSELCAEYHDKYAQHKLARPGAFASRIKPALRTFGSRPISQLRTSDIEDWQTSLAEPRVIRGVTQRPTQATMNRMVGELRRVLNWAVRRDWLASSPFHKGGLAAIHLEHEDNQRDRRISEDEEQALLAGAPKLLRGLIIMALDAGLRRGEMLELRVQDADPDREIVLRGTTTKSGRTRTVPISTLRLRGVIQWLRLDVFGEPKQPTAPLISNAAGNAIGTFRRVWENTVLETHGHVPHRHRKTGMLLRDSQQYLAKVNLHWHDLRREFASRLAERGVAITEIQRLLGHASVQTTERYISHTLARLKQSALVLESGKVFDPRSAPTPVIVNVKGVH